MFYDFKVDIYTKSSEVNEIGQEVNSYRYDFSISCDIQPSSKSLVTKTFGEDIDSIYTIFCDEDLKVGSIVTFNGTTYQINQKVDWVSYRIYSIVNVDVVLEVSNVN